jgi:O-antigen ligase
MTTLRESWQFWVLTAFLFLAFLTGGGSRDDIQSLVILRPAAVIFCGVAILGLRWDQVRAYRFLFAMTAAIFGLVILHLVPLPPSMWGALPGRGIVTEVDKTAQLGAVWRPISLVPVATWNALYSLFVPLAVLLLGVQLTREQRFQLLPVVLVLGFVSGLWGLLQSIGAPDGPLYIYEITSNGAAVGLFSNRNHHAVFLALLFPMLAVYASSGARTRDQVNRNAWLAGVVGTVAIPLILVTGSRAGLIIGVLALAIAILLFRAINSLSGTNGKARPGRRWRAAAGILAIVLIGGLTVLMARAEAFRRLFAPDQTDDLRFRIWGPITKMAWKYFPFGSGVGSFAEVYQIDEPYALLSPDYVNHAHNDWLEVYLTVGLPGLILLALAVFAFSRAVVSSFISPAGNGRGVSFARLGAVIISLLALASLGDYPLRTPSLVSVFAIAALWLTGNSSKRTKNASDA